MKSKLSTLIILLSILYCTKNYAQQISPLLYGQNAWVPTVFFTNTAYGRLDYHWGDLQNSGNKIVRVGGTAYNANQAPAGEYKYHDSLIKYWGMEPAIQVAVGTPAGTEITYSSTGLAKSLLNSLNSNPSTFVKYWIIGNEPDLIGYSALAWSAKMIKFADSLRAENTRIGAAPITVIGPELSYYNTGYMDSLILLNVFDHVDICTFHYYPFNNESVQPSLMVDGGYILPPDRGRVERAISDTLSFYNGASASSLKEQLQDLRLALNSAGHSSIPIAITEANICHTNDIDDPSKFSDSGNANLNITPGADDLATGNGANGFIAGQFWAEILKVAMEEEVAFVNFWSVIEGSDDITGDTTENNLRTNVGFIDYRSTESYKKKSTYYHFKMIADNMEGKYANGTTAEPLLKVFGSKTCHEVNVLLMNQDTIKIDTIQMRLKDIAFTGPGSVIEVRVDGGIDRYHNDIIGPKESLLLVFDDCGRLKKSERYSEVDNINNDVPLINEALSRGTCHRCTKSEWMEFQECNIPEEEEIDTLELRSNTRIDTAAVFSTVIKVPFGVKLEIDSAALIFLPGAYIEVKKGGQLVINESWLKGCDGSAWDGIRVQGAGDTTHMVEIRESIIDDADTAVLVRASQHILLENNDFAHGRTGVYLDTCRYAEINGNDFSNFGVDIGISRHQSGESHISENYFSDASTSVLIDHSNFTRGVISCNVFDNYQFYGIHSISSVLDDQGDSTAGAGNSFISWSTAVNHQFLHNGNSIKYWCDPSDPFTLVVDGTKKVTVDTAASDGCDEGHHYYPVLNQPLNAVAATTIADQASLFTVNPNPANEHVTITYRTESPGKTTELSLRNSYGTIVGTYTLSQSGKLDLALNEFRNGIYFLTLICDGKMVETKKIVVLH